MGHDDRSISYDVKGLEELKWNLYIYTIEQVCKSTSNQERSFGRSVDRRRCHHLRQNQCTSNVSSSSLSSLRSPFPFLCIIVSDDKSFCTLLVTSACWPSNARIRSSVLPKTLTNEVSLVVEAQVEKQLS